MTAAALCRMENASYHKCVFATAGRLSVGTTNKKENQTCATHPGEVFQEVFQPALREKCEMMSLYLGNSAGGWVW